MRQARNRLEPAGTLLVANRVMIAANPSVSTAADNTFTIWRSPLSEPFSLHRTRSRMAGNSQFLNGAPFLGAPSLTARPARNAKDRRLSRRAQSDGDTRPRLRHPGDHKLA